MTTIGTQQNDCPMNGSSQNDCPMNGSSQNGCPTNGSSQNGCPTNESTQNCCPINGSIQSGVNSSCGIHQSGQVVYISPINGEKFVIPDGSRKCTWSKTAKANGVFKPHTTEQSIKPGKIAPDVLNLIGNTPMVKLNSIPKRAGIKCNMYAKLEYFNPGGSIKDRIAKRMIEDAEHQGLLKPGMTIIEPSSGNTGVGMALASAIKGYKCIIVMCEKMSNEKVAVMNALGAKLIKTPITADSYSPEGIFGVANRLHKEIPDSLILDQFSNPGNPLAHYDTTAEEILDQCDNNVDILVLGAGTGGTVTGISRKFKEVSPATKVVGVDPEGSVFAIPEALNNTDVTFFEVEGLGYDFVPTSLDQWRAVKSGRREAILKKLISQPGKQCFPCFHGPHAPALDQTVVDLWMKTNDDDSLTMARRLIREEGILCGTSSGAAVSAALKVAKDLKEGQTVVVVIPDSIRNYLTKFVSDHWMEARGFQPCENKNNYWWWDDHIKNFPYRKINTVFVNETCDSVLSCMKGRSQQEMAVLKLDGNILGTVTLKHLINKILAKEVALNDKIENCTIRIYPKVDLITGHLGLVSRILEKENYVIVTESSSAGYSKKEKPMGVIDITDLYEYISQGEKNFKYRNVACNA